MLRTTDCCRAVIQVHPLTQRSRFRAPALHSDESALAKIPWGSGTWKSEDPVPHPHIIQALTLTFFFVMNPNTPRHVPLT